MEVAGFAFPSSANYDHYQGIYVGNHLCELRDPVINNYYGMSFRSGYRSVRCLVTEQIPGSYNASVFVNFDDRINVKMDSGHLQRGKSLNHSASLRLDHTNRLSMIELFPGELLILPIVPQNCVYYNVMHYTGALYRCIILVHVRERLI